MRSMKTAFSGWLLEGRMTAENRLDGQMRSTNTNASGKAMQYSSFNAVCREPNQECSDSSVLLVPAQVVAKFLPLFLAGTEHHHELASSHAQLEAHAGVHCCSAPPSSR